MITGVLRTNENSNMSLSCHAVMKIVDGVVTDKSHRGMPRSNGDSWYGFYTGMKIGATISQEDIDHIVGYNNRCNVHSSFIYEKED